MALKNEVRMKASLEKLRIEDLTPNKFSVGRLNIRKDLYPAIKNDDQEIQRLIN